MNSTDHNRQNKIAVINDFSGFGRCSITVSLPVISQLKIQCCPVPTSIFSNHTGFDNFFFDDYTEKMTAYIDNWKKLELKFNGILTGFLGSKEQIDIVEGFIRDFKDKNTVVIIDPVMGDDGKPYSTYTMEMCLAMKRLIKHADIITPNLTEACLLTDTVYSPETFAKRDYYAILDRLSELGASKIVITGIDSGEYIYNYIHEKDYGNSFFRQKKIGHIRAGTGDIFASVIAADAVHNTDFKKSVKRASSFVKKCIAVTVDVPSTDGVCFEEVLHTLKP